MAGYTYILASNKLGTLYIGVTSDLIKRVYEHKNGITKGFLSKYEAYDSIEEAIKREKQLKNWNRE